VHSTLIKLKEKGLKLGIVTDAPKKQAFLRLAEMNLSDFFDIVVALEDTGKTKPSPLPFNAAIEKMNLKPGEILFVGDNPARDIAGAKKAKMKTALAKYGQIFPEKEKADFELKSFQELLEIVK